MPLFDDGAFAHIPGQTAMDTDARCDTCGHELPGHSRTCPADRRPCTLVTFNGSVGRIVRQDGDRFVVRPWDGSASVRVDPLELARQNME